MLPLIHRLPLRTTRRDLESRAQTFHSNLFTILVGAQHVAPSPSRFAIILSKKITNSAVTRNRLRRQTLAAIQELLPQIKSGFDCLLLAKKSLLTSDYSQIKSDVEHLFRQAHLL